MKQYEIKPIENLSAVVAFRPKEIQVSKSIYDMVPDIHKENFNQILMKARESYESLVEQAKSCGEKPKAMALKSQVVTEIVNPFLSSLSIGEKPKVTRTIRPQEDKEEESIRVLTQEEKDKVKKLYNNFDSESLEDSKEETTSDTEDFFVEGEVDIFADMEISSVDVGNNDDIDVPDLDEVNFEDLI